MSYILDAMTSFPDRDVSQAETLLALQKVWPDHKRELAKFSASTLVETRHLVLPLDCYPDLRGLKKRNDAWIETAKTLSIKNVEALMSRSGVDYKSIGAIFSTSITGLAVPSIEARLMNLLPFSPDTKRIPLFGLGCLAGIAGINRIHDYLKAYPDKAALLIANEFCTLTLQTKDVTMANMIGAMLFGDGAGAVLMVGENHPLKKQARLKIHDTQSLFFPSTEHVMGWNIGDEGFELVLSSDVPQVIRESFAPEAKNFLKHNKLEVPEFFVMHPGGPKVLVEIQKVFNTSESTFQHSWESLKENGNLSSVSVIDVLKRTLARKVYGKGFMAAMGPAFSAEMTLVESLDG